MVKPNVIKAFKMTTGNRNTWNRKCRYKRDEDDKRPSDSGFTSGYGSVSSNALPLQELNEDKTGSIDEISRNSINTRRPSIVLMDDNGSADGIFGESHEFDATPRAHTKSSNKLHAFDAFGETKRRGVKSYNIEKRFLQVCRFVLYLVIFSVVLGGGVLAKLSVLSLVSRYNQSAGKERTTHAIYFLTLICVYPCLTLLSSLFKVFFGKVQSLTRRLIGFLMVIEFLHTLGSLLFLFKVLPQLTGIAALYVMMCASVVPSFLSVLNAAVCVRGKYHKRVLKLTYYFITFVLQIGIYISFYFLGILNPAYDVSVDTVWVTPLSIVLISVGWWENFVEFKYFKICKHFTFDTFKSDLQKPREKANIWTVSCRLLTVGIFLTLAMLKPDSFFSIEYNSLSQNTTVKFVENSTLLHTESFVYFNCSNESSRGINCNTRGNNNSSWNVLLSTKSAITPDISSKASTGSEITKQQWHMQYFGEIVNFILEHSLVLQIIALTFGVSYCGTLACKLHMQRLGFSLSTLLIGPLTFVYIFLKCGNKMEFEVIALESKYLCPTWELMSTVHIILVVILWISVCLLTYYVWFPDSERMAKLERMFITQLKDCLFVDFNLLLRRRKDTKLFHKKEGSSGRIVPKVYICATMWHENWKEMVQLLKSLLRIDRHCAVSKAAETNFSVTVEDPDKFEPEIHIIFDDAFCADEENGQSVPNTYVFQFMDCLEEAATDILGVELRNEWDSTPIKSTLPYGGCLTWTLPGKTKMVVHLKNKSKIRHRKRWSQIMYLYYLLGFKTFHYKSTEEVLRDRQGKKYTDVSSKTLKNILPEKEKLELENTFILTLDGDVDFKPKAVLLLIDRMKKNARVGAVCGRIHPIGSGPVVWYQKFEYAVGHWLQKAAEHVLGCVLCCPGCFSLFRASALMDDNVVKTYTKKPTKALHYIQFEQGEDRWLCTLLLQQGYKVDYCAGADAFTFAPETFNEFFIQRRRWSPSTNANIFDLLKSSNHTVRQNANISRLFMVYQGLMLATSLLAPATVAFMITGSYSSVLNLGPGTSYILSIVPIVFFITVCMKCKQDTQLFFAAILSSVYTIVMIIVTIGTLLNISSEQILSPNVLFLIGLAIIFSTSAIWHPKEFSCLLHGLLYYVAVPSTFIFLTIYYICNLNVVTWGTRENKQTQASATASSSKKKDVKHFSSVMELVSKKIFKINSVERSRHEHANETHHEDVNEKDTLDNVLVEQSRADVVMPEKEVEDAAYWMKLSEFSKCEIDKESQNENEFWNDIIQKYLLPIEGEKSHEEKIKADLLSLRNNIVFAFFLINFMFSIALLQLQMNREKLIQFYFFGKYEPVSVIFLSVFSILLVLQFISMLIHRWGTFQHLISSTRVLSCRKLSDKEKFEIHFREAKDQIEQNDLEYDSDTECDNKRININKAFLQEDNCEDENQEERKVANLYERQFSKNFERTLRMRTRTRKGLQSVNWNTIKFPKPRNNRNDYINILYQQSH